jgi:hypothetical protein
MLVVLAAVIAACGSHPKLEPRSGASSTAVAPTTSTPTRSTAVAATTGQPTGPTTGPTNGKAAGLGAPVNVIGEKAVAAFDAAGRLRFSTPGGTPSGDGRRLVREAQSGERTLVEWYDLGDGSRLGSVELDAGRHLAAVSHDGRQVALVDGDYPGSPGAGGASVRGRATTTITVATLGGAAPVSSTLTGNFWPEAFTLSDDYVATIELLPALAPTNYRVRLVAIGSGEPPALPLAWNTKTALDETMAGLRGDHVATGDGQYLYTLYRNEGGESFVHALDLSYGGQHCIDLPVGLGLDHLPGTIAASTDGSQLYVLSANGRLATIATHTHDAPTGTTSPDPEVVAVSDLHADSAGAVPHLAVAGRLVDALLGARLVVVDPAGGPVETRGLVGPVDVVGVVDGTPPLVAIAAGDRVWRADGTPGELTVPVGLGTVVAITDGFGRGA